MATQGKMNTSMDENTQKILQQLDPAVQKQAQERLAAAMKTFMEEVRQKNSHLEELRKIKVDTAVAKYLAVEFTMPQVDIELLLRKNDNNVDDVIAHLLTAQ